MPAPFCEVWQTHSHALMIRRIDGWKMRADDQNPAHFSVARRQTQRRAREETIGMFRQHGRGLEFPVLEKT